MRIGIEVRKAGGRGNERDQRAKPTKARSKVHLKSNWNFLHGIGHSLELALSYASALIASDTCFRVYRYSIRNVINDKGASKLVYLRGCEVLNTYTVNEQI